MHSIDFIEIGFDEQKKDHVSQADGDALSEYDASIAGDDMKIEVVSSPFPTSRYPSRCYKRLGRRLDNDVPLANGIRIIQFTPPGSGCLVTFDMGIAATTPGFWELVVSHPSRHGELFIEGRAVLPGLGRDSQTRRNYSL